MKKLIMTGILGCLVLTGCHVSSPAKGQKVGHIVKLAKEGMIFDTWEGELIRGGLTDGSGSFGNSFHFVIEDERLVDVALSVMEANQEVIIYYHCELFSSFARSEHSEPHFVDRIEIINKGPR